MQFSESNNATRVRETIRTLLQRGERALILERIDTVTENLYSRLASGDYGRGDVRRVILEEIENFQETA
jgi:hypothetical protein